MTVIHQRTGKTVRLSSSHKLFGQERETVDEAWPGDVIGLVGHDEFGIGDTLTEDKASLRRDPALPPEVFTYIANPNTGDSKKYRAGSSSSCRKASSSPSPPATPRPAPRCSRPSARCSSRSCNGASKRIRRRVPPHARAVDAAPLARAAPALKDPSRLVVANGVSFGADKFDHPVVLFPNEWTMRYFLEKNPELKLHALPLEQAKPAK
jgi:peptide chain release factor 3